VAAAPLAAASVGAAWQQARAAGPRARGLVGAGLACVLALVAAFSPLPRLGLDHGDRYPSNAALEAALREAPGRRMYNFYDWGGLLLYAGYPKAKVFIDGRAYPYPLEIHLACQRILFMLPGGREDLRALGVDEVFAPPGAPLVGALAADPGWRVVYHDDSAAVFVKKGPRDAAKTTADAGAKARQDAGTGAGARP
jgi:hypothetical protein